MSKNESSNAVNRRGFLTSMATAGGAAAASGLITQSANAIDSMESSPEDDRQIDQGYRITPHILEYYEKARF